MEQCEKVQIIVLSLVLNVSNRMNLICNFFPFPYLSELFFELARYALPCVVSLGCDRCIN